MKYSSPEIEKMNYMAEDVITASNTDNEVTVDSESKEIVTPEVGPEW